MLDACGRGGFLGSSARSTMGFVVSESGIYGFSVQQLDWETERLKEAERS
jgi:hypothetical protein